MSDETREALSGASKKQPRVVHLFNVPEGLKRHGTASIGLHELSMFEQQLAAKRASGDQFKQAIALLAQSLAEVDGSQVSLGDGTSEAALNKMHPKVLQLTLQAYASIHNPEDSDVSDFLASRQVKV